MFPTDKTASVKFLKQERRKYELKSMKVGLDEGWESWKVVQDEGETGEESTGVSQCACWGSEHGLCCKVFAGSPVRNFRLRPKGSEELQKQEI